MHDKLYPPHRLFSSLPPPAAVAPPEDFSVNNAQYEFRDSTIIHWSNVKTQDQECLVDFNQVIGTCNNLHQMYKDCYDKTDDENLNFFQKTIFGDAQYQCRFLLSDFDLCAVKRDLKKMRVQSRCEEDIDIYENCLMDKEKEFGSDFTMSMCNPLFDSLKACSRPVCERVDQQNEDTRLPIPAPISKYWLNDVTKNSWGISMFDRETIGRERSPTSRPVPRTAEGINKSGH